MKLRDEKPELTNETQVQAMWPDPNWESHLDQCFLGHIPQNATSPRGIVGATWRSGIKVAFVYPLFYSQHSSAFI